jgi:hypothetical protein
MAAAMSRFDAERDEAPIGDVKDATRLQRPKRRLHTEEYFLTRWLRSDGVDVPSQSLGDDG